MALSIKTGVSTWLWTSPLNTDTVDEVFRKISEHGFQAVEIAVEDPAVLDKQVVKLALEKYNLVPVVCAAFGSSRDLTHHDPAIHQQCFEYIEECLQCAVAWGANFVAGPMYSAVGKTRMLPPAQRAAEWQLAVKNLGIACEMAADYNCMLAIEPLNRFESDLVNTANDVVRMIRDINHPAAKIMLDSFHMNIEESDPYAAIITAGQDLIHMQISENHRGIPGRGITPWTRYRDALKAIRYSSVVSIESFTPQNQELAGAVCIWRPFAESQDQFAREGLRFMRELFNENETV